MNRNRMKTMIEIQVGEGRIEKEVNFDVPIIIEQNPLRLNEVLIEINIKKVQSNFLKAVAGGLRAVAAQIEGMADGD